MTIDLSLILKARPILLSATRWTHDKIIGKDILAARKSRETALEPILREATEAVSEIIEPLGEAEIDQICLFLTSPEAEQIIRQIYAASLLESKQQNLDDIQKLFLKEFSLYTNIPENELEKETIQIFYILVQGCEKVLTDAIDKGKLSAHEAKSNLRHRLLLDELNNIQKVLSFLVSLNQSTVEDILQFEENYRQQLSNRHGFITPPFVDQEKKIPIDDIYVAPDFLSNDNLKEKSQETLSISDFCGLLHRTVLLGDPGGGKSTFSIKLCYDLATKYDQRLFADRKITPILVILRDYASQKRQEPCSILEFITNNINANYQLKPPIGAIEYLLLNGRAVVIFDGLDELTDTRDRQNIRDDVESFANLYPSVPILVTSREVGYKEAPLDENRFDLFRLGSFNDSQVKTYVKNWFKLATDLTEEKQNKTVEIFINESKSIPDLQTNPLMLGLICNIYRVEGYIPRNRPDVYQKCADMLFERWDKGRNIQLPSSVKEIESKIRPTMMYLANWIYTDESLQGGVTEAKLTKKAAEYLLTRRFEDRDEAEQAAREFVGFCRGRAWVFTDVGTTKDGDNLYQFTHRTFLEYFTACSLVRNSQTTENLLDILLPRIASQEWDMVCQLAFKKQGEDSEDGGDELLNVLVEKADLAKDNLEKQGNLLYFAVRCLAFIVPSPKVTKAITKAAIDYCIAWGITKISQKDGFINKFIKPDQLLDNIYQSHDESLPIIIDKIKLVVIDYLNLDNEQQKLLVLEILDYFRQKHILNSTIVEGIKLQCEEPILKLLQQFILPNPWEYIWNKKVAINEFIKWHGLENLFIDYDFILFNGSYISIAYSVATDILNIDSLEDTERIKVVLKPLEEIIMVSPKPILKQRENPNFFINSVFDAYTFGRDEDLYFDLIFGFSLLMMIFLELDYYSVFEDLFFFLKDSKKPDILNYIFYTFIARFESEYIDKVQSELDNCKFTPEQQQLIWQWVHGEINFVEPEN